MSLSPNRLRCFYRCDDTGRILDIVHTHLMRGEGWHEASSQEESDRILHEGGRWRRDEAGALVRLPHVRLRVNDPAFKADGEDAAVWCVVALDLTAEQASELTVKVTVNGQAQEWRFGELHAVTTTTPGTWVVALADARYWAETRSVAATAHPPEAFAT